jgi:SRSO17 transposase
MIARALEADLPFGWVTADEAYGQVGRLRLWLEEHNLAYVLAVPKSQMVISIDLGQHRAHAVIAELAETDWKRLSCGDGAHGQRLYDRVALDIRPWRQPGYGHWPLVRRSITDQDEIAYYICYGPANTDLAELVRVAGTRWAIEEGLQTAKNETGLDHYQARRYEAWYRHITLSMAAAAFLITTRNTPKKTASMRSPTPD